MKITIDNLHIEKFITGGLKPVPRGSSDRIGSADLRSLLDAGNREEAKTVGKQREEIANLRSTNANLRNEVRALKSSDLAPDTVLTSYHDDLMQKWKVKYVDVCSKLSDLKVEHDEWGDKNDRLEARRSELNLANVSLKAENENLDTRLTTERQQRTMLHVEINKFKATIQSLEDKVAGYELGMSKAQVDKETGKGMTGMALKDKPLVHDLVKNTQKGTPRKVKRKLTDEEVWQIRRFVKRGCTDVWMQKHTGLGIATVHRIRHNKAYATVPQESKGAPICLHVGWGVTKQSGKGK